jgi:hypothetical protein
MWVNGYDSSAEHRSLNPRTRTLAKENVRQMVSIRVKDDGSQPIVEKGRETPFKQGEFYVFEVSDALAKYWNKMAPARREELVRNSRKQGKDIRVLLEAFVYKPAHVK